MSVTHQFVDRRSGTVITERLFSDRILRFLYCRTRESAPRLLRALTGPRATSLMGLLNFDLPLCPRLSGNLRFLRRCGVDLAECVDDPARFRTPRAIFERKIRYWECRPLPEEEDALVSPADSKMLVGSFRRDSRLYLKDKFFDFQELLGFDQEEWQRQFAGGDFAIFRLTPEKYHFNHTPVAGEVLDHYELDGTFHACHPDAVVEIVTPFSKNRRTVTIIQTDVPGGSGVGLVAMVEVAAMMIGQIVQCYSDVEYENPQDIRPGMFLRKGQVKSLYRPGSSTDVLIFQPERMRFSEDLVENLGHPEAESRFSLGFRQPLVETEVAVRSLIGFPRESQRS